MSKYPFTACIDIVGSSADQFHGQKKYVSTGALETDHIDFSQVENITYEEKPSRANLVASAGDILFAKMQNTKKTIILNEETSQYIYSTGFFAVRPKSKVINTRCLYHLVTSELFLRQKDRYCSGATQKAITNQGLEKIIVTIPDIADQNHIADLLDFIDFIITKCQQILDQSDQLIKSRFLEMFGNPILNSNDLTLMTLPELGELGRGVSKHRPRNAPELLGGKYPLIQTGDVANSELYIESYNSTYSDIGFRQSRMWSKGTLCITIAANIAKTAILTFDSCFPDSVVGFNANELTNNLYIHYWFSFFQSILEAQAPESAQKNINLKILSELKVIVPPKADQEQFANFVKQTDKSKSAVKQILAKAETLKKALMQEYFDA